MSNKYKDSMNKIAMDEDMKKRIVTNLKNMQDISDIKNKNNIHCINNEEHVNNIKSIDAVKKEQVSNSRLKIIRNLGMYAACFAVVLGGMAIKPFMSLPNLDKSSSKSSDIIENDKNIGNIGSEESDFSVNNQDVNSSEASNGSKLDVNVSDDEKNQSKYSLNGDKKARGRSIEGINSDINDGIGTAAHDGSSYSHSYDSSGEEQSSSGVSQVNDNSGAALERGNINDAGTDRNIDNSSNNISSDTQVNEVNTGSKNNTVNNEASGLNSSGISTANINNNEGRSAELSFNNLTDLKKKADFDFKVCEVLENNYSKSEINLILDEIVDITYTNNDNNIEFKTCQGKKDISGFDTYENGKTIKVDDIDFNLKGNGNSVKFVEWYEENMSYSIQSSKGLTSDEAIEIAESLKTFK